MSIWAIIPAKPPGAAKTRLAPACSPSARAALARRLFLRTVRTARACDALAGVIVVSADPELRALAVALGARAYEDPSHPQPALRCGLVPRLRRRWGRLYLCAGEGSPPAHEMISDIHGPRHDLGSRHDTLDCPPSPASGRGALGRRPQPRDQLAMGWGVRAGEDSLNRAVALGCRRAAESGASAALVLPADLLLLTPEVIGRFLRAAGDADVALAPDRAERGTNALLLRPPLALTPLFGPDSFARHRAHAETRDLTVATVRLPELALDLDTPDDLALAREWWRAESGEEAVYA